MGDQSRDMKMLALSNSSEAEAAEQRKRDQDQASRALRVADSDWIVSIVVGFAMGGILFVMWEVFDKVRIWWHAGGF